MQDILALQTLKVSRDILALQTLKVSRDILAIQVLKCARHIGVQIIEEAQDIFALQTGRST